jgi:FtsP/CotA-like multicopper oxidase with cupredoxin domain
MSGKITNGNSIRSNNSDSGVSRRRFMTLASVLGVGAVGTAVAPDGIRIVREPAISAAEKSAPATTEMDHSSHTGVAQAAPSNSKEMTAEEMDAAHEAGIASFPAPTEGLGGQPLEYTMDGDVKVFDLTCDIVQWEFAPGQRVEAWTYNGVVPGPEIRVTEGDKVRVNVTNNLRESTAVHWHGLVIPNAMDGVPFVTQPPIKVGESFTYEFQIRDGNAGTHMYHAHSNSAEQVTRGLLGSFIVEPKDPSTRPAFDREYTICLGDGYIGGYNINGKSFPATQPVTAKKGEKVLIRYMNEGMMIHPMHLHGMPMQVIAQDGYLLPQPYHCDTLNIAPGQRFEVLVDATEVGMWAFHCHILSHAEGPHGMFGMVTLFIVEE